MRKKIEWDWEVLDAFTKRAKVIGGWLIHHGSNTNKGYISESMCFVADRDHEWHITQPQPPVEEPAKNTVRAKDFEAS